MYYLLILYGFNMRNYLLIHVNICEINHMKPFYRVLPPRVFLFLIITFALKLVSAKLEELYACHIM